MKRLRFPLVLLIGLSIAASPALAAFVFRVGDTVYVDGKSYSWEEWKKIRDNPLPSQQPGPPGAKPGDADRGPAAAAPVSAGEPRAASCTTAIYYDEFPSEDEHFRCTAGLGMLTREQILKQGWKVDFVEKLPPLPGEPAQSPRGLPLYLYKLVISR
ncbi:MAG: hypothetical protein WBM28_17250 [Burkholderiales bacterium]